MYRKSSSIARIRKKPQPEEYVKPKYENVNFPPVREQIVNYSSNLIA